MKISNTLTPTLSPQGRGSSSELGIAPSPLRGEGWGEGEICNQAIRVIFTIFKLVIFLFLSPNLYAAEEGCSKVYSYLVFEEESGEILFEKDAERIAYPASLVKMMTLYLTFEALENHKLNPEKLLTISERGEEIAKVNKINTLHLKKGDKITVREAIHAVIVKSFNEAAVTLAEAVAGDEWDFARKMNKKAEELGMIDTSFRNASGLHEEGEYTTSYDLARLSKAIKKDFPEYYHLFALKNFEYRGEKFETHNHVLVDYKGAEGMKTGFTNAAGFNLISAAKKDNFRVVSILLGCATFQKRDQFTKKLLDDAFKKLSQSRELRIDAKLTKGFNYKVKTHGRDDGYESEMRFGMNFSD